MVRKKPDKNEPQRGTASSTSAAHIDDAINQLKSGIDTEQNFRRLYERYYSLVERFFTKRVEPPEDRLDLIQETFLRIYRGIGGFRRESEFGTWIFCIAKSAYSEWAKQKATRRQQGWLDRAPAPETSTEAVELLPHSGASKRETPLEEYLRKERRDVLRKAIGKLPEQMGRCMELRIYQNLSYTEIATIMQLNINTVKAHLFQGKKKLGEMLKPQEVQSPELERGR